MSRPETTPKLTPEQQRALDMHGGVVQGDSFVLMRKDVVLDFFGYSSQADLVQQLQPALDQADRGELQEWDVDAVLARVRLPYRSEPD